MANNKTDKKTGKKVLGKAKTESKISLFQKIRNFWNNSSNNTPSDDSDNMSKAEITRFCIGAMLFVVSSFILLRYFGEARIVVE